jgi:hypothetical protein
MKEYNFKFATEHKSSPMQPKKGDAYLYINGEKTLGYLV